MSISTSLQASARAAYRDLLRASASTFRGDDQIRNGVCTVFYSSVCVLTKPSKLCSRFVAFRLKMRTEVIPNAVVVTDSGAFEQKVTLAREIADVLRKNVVQAQRIEDSEDLWSECRRRVVVSPSRSSSHVIDFVYQS